MISYSISVSWIDLRLDQQMYFFDHKDGKTRDCPWRKCGPMEMPLLYKFLSVILWPLQHIPHEQHCSIPDVLVIHKESSIGGFFFFSSLDLQLLDFLSWYFHHNHICAPPILPLQVLCCTTRTIICFLNFANLTLLFPHKFIQEAKRQ